MRQTCCGGSIVEGDAPSEDERDSEGDAATIERRRQEQQQQQQ
ncbi:MAG: hypothetical protein U0441_13500 [Polyangiaceae bacterium]